ncbi:uncharacterized protein LOC143287010 isoform X1 [Babylonia areolata]|uniref:uncharacterized protein LOC143287010 isoform X1 n=1 Tax=Babylonia areolata TaxID=304850 RepID=UPI003FD11E3C
MSCDPKSLTLAFLSIGVAVVVVVAKVATDSTKLESRFDSSTDSVYILEEDGDILGKVSPCQLKNAVTSADEMPAIVTSVSGEGGHGHMEKYATDLLNSHWMRQQLFFFLMSEDNLHWVDSFYGASKKELGHNSTLTTIDDVDDDDDDDDNVAQWIAPSATTQDGPGVGTEVRIPIMAHSPIALPSRKMLQQAKRRKERKRERRRKRRAAGRQHQNNTSNLALNNLGPVFPRLHIGLGLSLAHGSNPSDVMAGGIPIVLPLWGPVGLHEGSREIRPRILGGYSGEAEDAEQEKQETKRRRSLLPERQETLGTPNPPTPTRQERRRNKEEKANKEDTAGTDNRKRRNKAEEGRTTKKETKEKKREKEKEREKKRKKDFSSSAAEIVVRFAPQQ